MPPEAGAPSPRRRIKSALPAGAPAPRGCFLQKAPALFAPTCYSRGVQRGPGGGWRPPRRTRPRQPAPPPPPRAGAFRHPGTSGAPSCTHVVGKPCPLGASPPHPFFPALRLAGKAPPGPPPSGTQGEGVWPARRPWQAPRGRALTGASPGSWGSAAGRPTPPRDQNGCWWSSPASVPRPRPTDPLGRGAAQGSFPTRPRTRHLGSHAGRELGPRDRSGPRGAHSPPTRPGAGGCGPAAPSEPGHAARAPASSPLVPGLGAGSDASGRLRAGMERSGGEAGPLLSLWLPLGRRRLYLTAAVPARTRHMG